MAKLIMIWDISTSKLNFKKQKERDENKDKEDCMNYVDVINNFLK